MGWTYSLPELARVLDCSRDVPNVFFSSISTDTRTLTPGSVFFALKGERFDGNTFVNEAFRKGAIAAVIHTEASLQDPPGPCLRVPDTLTALQSFAAWHRSHYSLPIIAITGSCGKTSTKDFAAAVLSTKYKTLKTEGNLNNDIGCPLTISTLDVTFERAVIEMGASRRGDIKRLCRVARPTESAITMIGPAHLEFFGSIEAIAATKAEIMEALPPDGVFYVNTDDPRCVAIAERFSGTKVFYGSKGTVYARNINYDKNGMLVADIAPVGLLSLPLPIPAQLSNVLLAIAVGLRHGVEEFQAALESACAHSSRFRLITRGPVEILDDSYNANPASMKAAIDALCARKQPVRIAAIGSMLELGEESERYHAEIGRYAAEKGVSHVFTRGPYSEALVEAALTSGVPTAEAIEDADKMAHAIQQAASHGGTVLIKGSRSTRMEEIRDALMRLLSEEHTHDETMA
jgi:UDP-N-acetylmuramoyl-tripeptide--D-alanyl-D-alanine ligase